jgi:3-hydroxyacyl-[acyl-carrier-protein] dehydratase
MAPQLLFDISGIDFDRVEMDAHAIERVNPHRGNMRLLDGVFHVTDDVAVAYHDVRDDAFWVAGHIPGRPIMPGVLMIEVAAQLVSLCSLRRLKDANFLGFSGADDVKFRGQVEPGQRLIVLASVSNFRPRRCICKTQGLVDGTLVYEGTITGMPL